MQETFEDFIKRTLGAQEKPSSFDEFVKQKLTPFSTSAPERAKIEQAMQEQGIVLPTEVESYGKFIPEVISGYKKTIAEPVTTLAKGFVAIPTGYIAHQIERFKGKSPEEAASASQEISKKIMEYGIPPETGGPMQVVSGIMEPIEKGFDFYSAKLSGLTGLPQEDLKAAMVALSFVVPAGIQKAFEGRLLAQMRARPNPWEKMTVGEITDMLLENAEAVGIKPQQPVYLEVPKKITTEKINIIENGRPKQLEIKFTPEELIGDLTNTIINESAAISKIYPSQPVPLQVYHAGVDLRAAMESLGIPSAELQKTFAKLKDYFHSPDIVLGRDIHGQRIYDTLNFADLEKVNWSDREMRLYKQASKGIKEGEFIDTAVFKIRDNRLSMDNVLKMTPDEAAEFGISKLELQALKNNPNKAKAWNKFLDEKFDYLLRKYGQSVLDAKTEARLWKAANSKELPSAEWLEKLNETEKVVWDVYKKKISDYVPHIFDRSELLSHLQNELEIINNSMTKVTPDSKPYMTMERQRAKIITSIDNIKGGKPLLYDILPESVRFKFFETRRGMSGYQVSSVKAYRTYVNGIAKKIFDEPALRKALIEYQNLPESMKPYANWYLREYMGYNQANFERLFGGIKSFIWMRTLGFNPRSAIVNLTQRLNTVADVGPLWSERGWRLGFTEEGKALFDRTGLAKTTPTVLMEGRVPNTPLETLREISGWMFSKIEEGNLKHAFLSNYLKLKNQGMTPEIAFENAIKGAQKVQFRYGRVGTPRALRGGGGVAFQFWSYPIKQIELMQRWFKENPLKLIGWLAMAEGGRYALDEFLGIDLSSALGIVTNYGELLSTLKAMPEGDLKKLYLHAKQAGVGGGIAPYGFGPALEMAENIGNVLTGEIPSIEGLGRAFEPTTVQRIRQDLRALVEGEKEGEYPIRAPYDSTLLYRESPVELFSRVFLGRPSKEVEVSREAYRKALEDVTANQIVREMADAIVQGKLDEAMELSIKYKIPISTQAITNAFMRYNLTKDERTLLDELRSSSKVLFREEMRK